MRRRTLIAFAGYLALSLLLIGRHVLGDPQHLCACAPGSDPPAYMWALRWWPYALTHAANPFFTHVVWAPNGANVASAALIPLPSLALWLLTAAAGPIAAYDALVLLSPALAASTAFVLCRRVCGASAPAAIGGLIFGFGSYELAHALGHPNLALVWLVPLIAWLALEYERFGRRRYVTLMSLALAAQLLSSTEVLAGVLMFGALALILARRLRTLLAPTVLAGVIAGALCSPYLLYSAVRAVPHGPPDAGNRFATDLLSLFVPEQFTALGHGWIDTTAFPGGVAEHGAYFGLLLLAAFALSRPSRLLAGVFALSLLAALGSHLFIDGTRTIPLPWALAGQLPVLRDLVPARLIVYAWLALSVAIALWLAPGGRRRWAAVLLGVALIAPNAAAFRSRPSLPALFSAPARVFTPGEVVLAIPFGQRGSSMLWQAQSRFYFRLAEGYLSGVPPAEFLRAEPLAPTLIAGRLPAPAELAGFLARHAVRHVVIDPPQAGGWPGALQALGWHASSQGGALLFSPPAGGP
ncbi:MAG: hypothetical protein NVSMB51_00300 [Solirubrobacteraceae bacterium]